MPIPRVLAIVAAKCLASFSISVPGVGDKRFVTVAQVRDRSGKRQRFEDPPRKGQCREWHVPQEGVFARERGGGDGIGHGSLRIGGCIIAGMGILAVPNSDQSDLVRKIGLTYLTAALTALWLICPEIPPESKVIICIPAGHQSIWPKARQSGTGVAKYLPRQLPIPEHTG